MNQADQVKVESVSESFSSEQNGVANSAVGGREAILRRLIATVSGMIQDWERDVSAPITGTTLLIADLGYQSLDIVVLTADMSRQLNRRDLPFERLLLVDGRPVSDLSLDTMAGFLWEQVDKTTGIEAR